MSAFSEETIQEMADSYETVMRQHEEIQMTFIRQTFRHEGAKESAHQGFLRRLSMMKHCVQTVFVSLPPERESLPTKNNLNDASMALHAFVINVFGCVDNLATILVKELPITKADGLDLPKREVGLRQLNATVRGAISDEFRTYLESIDEWFGYLESYRHSLAHRVPLYIAPFMITDEDRPEYDRLETEMALASQQRDYVGWDQLDKQQEQLGLFRPIMSHSPSEPLNHVYFHPQMICDYNTIAELSNRVLREIRN